MISELKTIYNYDPTARGLEPLVYPGLHAVIIHRLVTHNLYKLKLKFLARVISQIIRFFTGIEIHPEARIAKGVFIDHGYGVVIGSTAVVGENSILHHNVTLGSTGKMVEGKQRHPIIGKNVFIGTNATILGPSIIGDGARIGAGTLIIDKNIPNKKTAVGNPVRIIDKTKVEKFCC